MQSTMAASRLLRLALLYWQYRLLLGQDTSCIGVTNATCNSCFNLLVSKTIDPDSNQFNLQRAFIPPETTNPVYVTVNYTFVNGKSEVWYWSKSTYYASFHPLELYQYLSFFFGDFQFLSTHLTLEVDCGGVQVEERYMRMLTQRLKLFAIGRSITPRILDEYEPKAESETTVGNFHENRPTPIRLLMSAQIVFPFMAIVWFVILAAYYKTSATDDSQEAEVKMETKLKLGIRFTISFMFSLYALVLSCVALGSYRSSSGSIDWFNSSQKIQVAIFMWTCFFDLAVLIVFEVCVFVFATVAKKFWWTFCASSIAFPVLTVAAHFNYIMFAFIQNKDHAVSIGIFYAIVVLVNIYVLYVVSSFKCISDCEFPSCFEPLSKCGCLKNINFSSVLLISIQLFTSLIVNLLFAYVAAIYVTVPINKAFSEAPNRIRLIYDTLIVSFLGVAAYFFLQKDKKKDNEEMIELVLAVIARKQEQAQEQAQSKTPKQTQEQAQEKTRELEMELTSDEQAQEHAQEPATQEHAHVQLLATTKTQRGTENTTFF